MDPLTQGLLGAAAAHAALGRQLGTRALLVGGVAGVLPDADLFIRSAADPLLAIEYHRQFTHSLAFIPVGGLLAALPWLVSGKNRREWKSIAGAAIVGYGTHGLLDACTTFGTQLLWPFSDLRVAFHVVSVIDPLFTLVLLIGVIAAAMGRSRGPAAIALILCVALLAVGAVQRNRALDVQERLASVRGHTVIRGEVFPTAGNHLVWRSLYLAGDSVHADRIRVPWFGDGTAAPGMSVPLAEEHDLEPAVRKSERVIRDFRRVRWFSGGWLARDPEDPSVIGDARYSMRRDAFEPVWGVRFHPEREIPTEWVDRSRSRRVSPRELWNEILGRDPRYREIPQLGRQPWEQRAPQSARAREGGRKTGNPGHAAVAPTVMLLLPLE
jgi:inner membrane protein